MKDTYIWGTTLLGRSAYESLQEEYHIVGFLDEHFKSGYFMNLPIFDMDSLKGKENYQVIVAEKTDQSIHRMKEMGIKIGGYYSGEGYKVSDQYQTSFIKATKEKIKERISQRLTFSDVASYETLHFYAGDIPKEDDWHSGYRLIGLSINKSDTQHIRHDITQKYPMRSGTVDSYQAEDVFEHIEYEKLVDVIDEIYRILKPGGYFRLSVPDYRCDLLKKHAVLDENKEVVFDPAGGGRWDGKKVLDGGHVWNPTYEKVADLLKKSKFQNINFLHYYDTNGTPITKDIDYHKGFVKRTPDNYYAVSCPYRPMSIVVDCMKENNEE